VADRGKQYRTQYRFELGGTTYEYKGHISAADALLIKQHAGMTVLEMFMGLPMGDPGALIGLVLITKRQAGEKVTWDEVVEQIDGENDLFALLGSMEPIEAPEEPAQKVASKKAAKKEPEPEPAVA
jgi:hypothetical protein